MSWYKSILKEFKVFSFRVEIIFHLLFWLIYFIYPILQHGDQNWFVFDLNESIINLLFILIPVYLFYFFILFNKHKKLINWIIILFIIILNILIDCAFQAEECDCSLKACFFHALGEIILIITFIILLLEIRRGINNEIRLNNSEKQRINAELRALKAQLNPHFLFNTLNMIYSEAIELNEKLGEKILMLSDNIHYLLHEGDKMRVPIEHEIRFINDYIDLQRARLESRIDVTFEVNTDGANYMIPPLLMIPFIENAFKYSSLTIGTNIPVIIKINFSQGTLFLEVSNQYIIRHVSDKKYMAKEGGIGIVNVKKRLELLFPDTHHLKIYTELDWFHVRMKIDKLDFLK